MGWAGGSRLFSEVISAIKSSVDDYELRESLYIDLIEAFEEMDWDTQDECLGQDKAYDSALYELHPEWLEDEDRDDEDD